MPCQKRTFALSYHVKARFYLVHIDFQETSRDRIRQTKYSSRNGLWLSTPVQLFIWVLWMSTTSRYHWWRNYCENTEEGNTFRKDWSSQSSVWSPWGSHGMLIPSLCVKMAEYIKERQTIANPFHCNWNFLSRPNPSPFANLQKAVPKKEENSKSHPEENEKELYSKEKGYLPPVQGKADESHSYHGRSSYRYPYFVNHFYTTTKHR